MGMDGKSPLAKLRELGWDLPDEFACFPVVLLDEVAVDMLPENWTTLSERTWYHGSAKEVAK